MHNYELRVTSNSQVFIIPFEALTLSEELNVGVSGSLRLNYLALERYAGLFNLTPDGIFGATYAEWQLYLDGTVLYAGIFNHRQASGSKSQGTAYSLNLLGFEYLLKSRYTGNAGAWAYLDDDSADIAWDMINKTQTDTSTYGDVGITRGLHPTTVNRDKTNRYDNIYDAIVSMSALKKYNGYDWEISPQKVFNIYYPKGVARANLILDDFNIISWSCDRDMTSNLVNRVMVLGAGNEDNIVTATVEDIDSMGDWYLQEATLSEKATSLISNLEDKGNRLLTDRKTPKDLVTVRISDTAPDVTAYNVGDTLPVKIETINFNKNLRIDTRTLQIGRTGEAVVDLSFQYAT